MSLDHAIKDYVCRFIGSVAGHRVTPQEVDDETCRRVFTALSRSEELATTVRDQWGGWDWQYSRAQRRGELYVPWLDESLAGLRRHIHMSRKDAPGEPLWPDGKRFAICLTHDVDELMWHVGWGTFFTTVVGDLRSNLSLPIRAGRAKWLLKACLSQAGSYTSCPAHNFDEWLKLEAAFGFKSTFYFFPSRLRHRHRYDCSYQFHDRVCHGHRTLTVADMMKEIDQAGWEIGLHGSIHSATRRGLLAEERQQIEAIIGRPVVSTRQHWLRYDVNLTPRLQAEAGFLADSTQGFNRSIGFRAGTSFPYWCWDHGAKRPLPVLEIPQHIMDGGLFTANALEYNEDLAIEHSFELMDAVERVGGCLTLSWHPHNVNNRTYWSVYKTLLEEAARRRAWGCTAGELYRWWVAREQRLQTVESRQASLPAAELYH